MLAKYRSAVQNDHGWEVELTCPSCGHTALPRYDGWTPDTSINFGSTPTMFALIACSKCAHDLRDVAGKQLVAMFSDMAVSKLNKRLIAYFVVGVVLVVALPIIVQFAFKPKFHVASFGAILFVPLIFVFNYRVVSMRKRCTCGAPKYIFMGLLGRSYCYRCSNCARLLRLRD